MKTSGIVAKLKMLSVSKSARMIGMMICGASLVGCASTGMHPASQSVGHIQAGKGQFVKVDNAAKVRTKVVREYIPVAVPGQLMPMPNAVGGPKALGAPHKVFLSKEKAVAYANKHAQMTPTSTDFFNAMMTYNFMPGALYTVYCAPMKITDIALQKGEKIVSIAAGDTLRWQISQTYSGQGADLTYHILAKPNQSNLKNTVIVTTNRRVYHLILNSTSDGTFMVSVKWHYPTGFVQYPNGAAPEAAATSDRSSASPYQLDLGSLNFNYQFGMVTGGKPRWYPVRVFDNGRQTFIEFPKNFNRAQLPMLFVATDQNDDYGTAVNWRVKGRFMIYDGVFKSARLQTGVKSTGETIVQIEHKRA